MKRVEECKREKERERKRERERERLREGGGGKKERERRKWKKQNGLAVPHITTATRRCEKRLLSKYNIRLVNYYSTIIKINSKKAKTIGNTHTQLHIPTYLSTYM